MNSSIRCVSVFKHIVLFGTLVLSSPVFADMVIIVHRSSSLNSIDNAELGRLFLGKSSEFSDGTRAKPINQVPTSDMRQEFDSTILNRNQAQLKSYWSKMMFSGEGTPPEELNGDLDVLKKVMEDTSAIGYVDSSAVNGAVKVLKIK